MGCQYQIFLDKEHLVSEKVLVLQFWLCPGSLVPCGGGGETLVLAAAEGQNSLLCACPVCMTCSIGLLSQYLIEQERTILTWFCDYSRAWSPRGQVLLSWKGTAEVLAVCQWRSSCAEWGWAAWVWIHLGSPGLSYTWAEVYSMRLSCHGTTWDEKLLSRNSVGTLFRASGIQMRCQKGQVLELKTKCQNKGHLP